MLGEEKMKTREGQNKNGQTCFLSSSQNNLFKAYIKKITTFFFWCMVVPLVHIWFTPNEGPKGFVN
jgi:hypothetical protein